MSFNSSSSIKIATLNLFNFIEPPNAFYDFANIYGRDEWEKKQTWIKNLLDGAQPDIIGFQEVFSPEALKTLMASIGYPYFSTLDTPTAIDDYIYRSPVVAFASKYPILEQELVQHSPELSQALCLSEDFSFSRQPLRVAINLPEIGICDCYVIHFKSKRALFDVELIDEPKTNKEDNPTILNTKKTVLEKLAIESAAKWGASMLRGWEASQLKYAMIKQKSNTRRPMILMGDFNDELHSDPLSPLISSDSFLKRSVSESTFESQRLFNSFSLNQHNESESEHKQQNICPPTHYYFAKGSVLDYILLSNEFNRGNVSSIAEVTNYQTFDKHLINPIFSEDSQASDHACVMITLQTRK
ncbi:endonuclease/exonuclease/phosphatase family protein [Vibrio sp. SS-MA-C1-2]|uniref:endonuclease/exonuclease/phosphatase family protein n=1 Tax=Vibrio sp. SS-MA-C1-2 TaxID=2908646 RepID=UPI001F455180|nr:endonuclease/exonuclease/phosphatase family protein [Vibrio sp. SS-MA-C1-2]UJF19874.1 endonuclease/exonuclease/phosphatase family protein [Vibrio sp. SS-MA-C1-2]